MVQASTDRAKGKSTGPMVYIPDAIALMVAIPVIKDKQECAKTLAAE